jgi:hypothetical protein
MTKSGFNRFIHSKAAQAEAEADSSFTPEDMEPPLEETPIAEELEETGIMGGFCEQTEDEL